MRLTLKSRSARIRQPSGSYGYSRKTWWPLKENKTEIFYVQKLDLANGLFLAPHKDANCDARHRDKTDPFKFLQMRASTLVKSKIRRVIVNEIGRIRDSGAAKP